MTTPEGFSNLTQIHSAQADQARRGAGTPAILYAPPGPGADRWRAVCADYALSRRYAIVAIATTWQAVITTLMSGEAAVAVVARRDMLPANRTPRLEVVTEQASLAAAVPERRPQRVPRR